MTYCIGSHREGCKSKFYYIKIHGTFKVIVNSKLHRKVTLLISNLEHVLYLPLIIKIYVQILNCKKNVIYIQLCTKIVAFKMLYSSFIFLDIFGRRCYKDIFFLVQCCKEIFNHIISIHLQKQLIYNE